MSIDIRSNNEISQQEIYAGIGVAGAVTGAALAVRATSDVYKKDKKGKDTAKDVADDVIQNNASSSGRMSRQEKKITKGRVQDPNEAYYQALQMNREMTREKKMADIQQGRIDDHNRKVRDANNARVDQIRQGTPLSSNAEEIAQVQQLNMNRAANEQMLKERRSAGTPPKKKNLMNILRRKIG